MYPPTQEKVEEIIRGFGHLGFPQCFGAVDGCHIEVNPPKTEAVDYYNYKGWYSTVLFAAVDYRYRFTYINVGSPGRCNDSTLFENSLLKVQHEQNVKISFRRILFRHTSIKAAVSLFDKSTLFLYFFCIHFQKF